jgi:serine/threonine-protein kinase
VILYECLTGCRPFQADNLYATFQAIVAGSPIPPRAHRPDLSPELEEVVMRAMNVDPRARYASARDLGRALCGFASARSRLLWEDAFGSVAGDFGRAAGATPPPRSVAVTQILQAGSTPLGATPPGRTPPVATPASPLPRGPGSGGVHVGRAGGTRILTPVSPRMFQQNVLPTPLPIDPRAMRSPVARRGAIVGAVVGVAILVGVWLVFLRPDSSIGLDSRDNDATLSRHPRSVAPPIADPSDSPEGPSTSPTAASPGSTGAAFTAPATATSPAPAPDTFRVSLTVDPEAALIELDGKVAGRGTLRRTLPIDHEKHTLRVSADGYDPQDIEFTDAPPPDERIELSTHVVAGPGGGGATRPRHHPTKHKAARGGPTLNPNGAPIID